VDHAHATNTGHATPERIRALFHSRGLRWTRQREVIYSVLEACHSHPTPEELSRLVEDVEPGLSLATIYNTLDAFLACGLCNRLASADATGAARYDADIHDHAHVQTSDGRVLDVPADLSRRVLAGLPQDLLAEIERRMGVKVGRVSVQFHTQPV
jgi:Fe2+ or Zn2+ uptake regulation protein